MKTYKKQLNFWLKALVSMGLLSFLLIKFDLDSLVTGFRSLNPWWFLLFFLLPHIAILLSAWKWQILLRSNKVDERLPKLLKLYLVGTFFNNFLPTMAGGDVVRVARLAKDNGKTASIIAATYMERLSGVAALIIFLIAILFDKNIMVKLTFLPFAIGIFAISFLCVILLSFYRRLYISIFEKVRGKRFEKIISKIENIQEAIFHYHDKPFILLKSLAISLLFYVLACFTVYFAGMALTVEVPLTSVFIVVPLVIMVGMLPVTLNGLGLNESSYVFFFALFEISASAALSIALLLRFRILFTAVLGGGLFVCDRVECQKNEVKSDCYEKK